MQQSTALLPRRLGELLSSRHSRPELRGFSAEAVQGLSAPSLCQGLRTLGQRRGGREPREARLQAEDGPLPTLRLAIADQARLADQPGAQAVEPEVQFGPALAVGSLELEESRSQEEAVLRCRAGLHRRQVRDDLVLWLSVSAVLPDEPGKACEFVLGVVLGHKVADKGPWSLSVQAMDPPGAEGFLDLVKRGAGLVVHQRGIPHHCHHVLEAEGSRALHLAVDGGAHGEGPGHSELGAAWQHLRLLLRRQHAVQGAEHRARPAPGAFVLAQHVILVEVRLVHDDQRGHRGMPGALHLEALFEALEGGLLPLLEAVEVVAELGLGAVVAWHDIQLEVQGPVQEALMRPGALQS
mmetsp:Transcript_47355/g.112582  ORF Transcript_47355/g.112582 Transcript_47355/m.112582 type:complete len:353 (+) Transcript_47355:81-1139(+)